MVNALRVTIIGAIVLAITALGFAVAGESDTPSAKEPNVQTTHVYQPNAIDAYQAQVDASNRQQYEALVTQQHVQEYVFSVQMSEVAAYVASVEQAEYEARVQALNSYLAALAPPPAPTRSSSPAPVYSAPSGGGNCASGGGQLNGTSAENIARESGGNYCAYNPSGACGAYQIMPGTWGGFGGYASACDAPPAVQDEKARSMAPCNWEAPNYCA